MIPTTVRTVAIIGAGIAGLATARALLQRGLACTVYDRNETLGGVWADGYVGFGVQVQKELYEFPEFPLPGNVRNFTPGPVFQRYMEDYCDHFGIRPHLRLGARIEKMVRAADGQNWTLMVDADGARREETADIVIVASGLYSETPSLPDLPGMSSYKGDILHSSEIKDLDRLKGRKLAIIGYGKSATDIAGEAAAVADETHLIFRDAHWPVPRKLAGILPFKWGMLNRLTAALIPPYVRPSPVERGIATLGRPLPWLFWRIVEILLRVQLRLDTRIAKGGNLLPDHPVEIDAFGETTMVPRPNFIGQIRSGRIQGHRTTVASFTNQGVVLENGETLNLDTVVFATGWKAGYEFLSDEDQHALKDDGDGFYLYRHILHPDTPGLFFIGRASSFLSVATYSIQARWLAELIAGNVKLPAHEEMRDEIDKLREWKQSWMPPGSRRSARVLLHMAHYHDEMLRDFGADPLRKKGILAPLKEILFPYQPSDFAEVVTDARPAGQQSATRDEMRPAYLQDS